MTVEVCFECDIIECYHIRARRAAPPDVAQAARVLLADDAVLTEMAIGIMRNNKPDVKGNKPGYRPALTAALRAIADGETP